MYNLLRKLFIRNYKNTEDSEVREQYGRVFVGFSIICNVFLAVFKFAVSIISGSVSIRADAFNNLSDVGGNVAMLIGIRLSGKHPDKEHPYGHERIEYISGMIIAFLIAIMGFEAGKEAITSIILKSKISFSFYFVGVLILSILIKLLMASVDKKAGKDISSDTLIAAYKDSVSDVLTTSGTLFSLLLYRYFGINIDGIIGLLLSIVVLKNGAEIFMDETDKIIGKAPDIRKISQIVTLVKSYDEILGVHDVQMHDYGNKRSYIVLHAEVRGDSELMSIHDVIDRIEKEIEKNYSIHSVIHIDPVDVNDEESLQKEKECQKIVEEFNTGYSIHDFRVVHRNDEKLIEFEVAIPIDDTGRHEAIEKAIRERIASEYPGYRVDVQVEHLYF